MHVVLEVSHDKANVKKIVLRNDTVIGRSPDCSLKIASSLVSRRHCEIKLLESQVSVRDLGSANGTFVDGRQLDKDENCLLMPGNVLLVGPLKFVVRFDTPSTKIGRFPANGALTEPAPVTESFAAPAGTPAAAEQAGEPAVAAVNAKAASSADSAPADDASPPDDDGTVMLEGEAAAETAADESEADEGEYAVEPDAAPAAEFSFSEAAAEDTLPLFDTDSLPFPPSSAKAPPAKAAASPAADSEEPPKKKRSFFDFLKKKTPDTSAPAPAAIVPAVVVPAVVAPAAAAAAELSDAVTEPELDLEAPDEFVQEDPGPNDDATLMMTPDEDGIADFLSAPQDPEDQTIMIPPGGDEAPAEEEAPATDDDDLSNFLGMFK